jgi:uncharacterized membrane protein
LRGIEPKKTGSHQQTARPRKDQRVSLRTKLQIRAIIELLGGAYYNPKDQVSAPKKLREKLPRLDTPEPASIKRDRPRRTRQLGHDQIQKLIAG